MSSHEDHTNEREGDEETGPVQAARDGKITNREEANALGLSIRQFRRLKGAYTAEGSSGLVHGLRGGASSRRLAPDVRERLRGLACETYADHRFSRIGSQLLLSRTELPLSLGRPRDVRGSSRTFRLGPGLLALFNQLTAR